MRPYRSMLFVPGNKPSWMEKAIQFGPDAVILDLEDSVPDDEKVSSRRQVKEGVRILKSKGQPCYVRINGLATGLTFDDLEGVVSPELNGVSLPKVESVDDIKVLDAYIECLERRINIPVGTVEIQLVLETAKAMRNTYEIAISCPRIHGICLAAGPGGDANRAIGYVWSKEGKETLFLRSKAVLDSRAAGIQYPMIISWLNIRDLDGLEKDALLNRQLGFKGQVVIHPSHVSVVNKIFTPSVEEITYCKGLIDAVDEAETKGSGAVVYKGNMVDRAMVTTALEMLEFAKSIGLTD
jgi:citrate lyase subunit beta / citryl-CoA lyase